MVQLRLRVYLEILFFYIFRQNYVTIQLRLKNNTCKFYMVPPIKSIKNHKYPCILGSLRTTMMSFCTMIAPIVPDSVT